MSTMDPNHIPKHRADRDVDSPSLAHVTPPVNAVVGLVIGKRRSFGDQTGTIVEEVLRGRLTHPDWIRGERGSAGVLAVVILGMFGAFVLVVAMAARSFALAGIQ